MIVGTFQAIAGWAKDTLDALGTSGQVHSYHPEIRTNEKLIQRFGTGDKNPQGEEIMRGWLIDVNAMEIDEENMPFGNQAVYIFSIAYSFIQSLEDEGQDWGDTIAYVESVINALQEEMRPSALVGFDQAGGNLPITGLVEINRFYRDIFPDSPQNATRLHHRVDMTQQIRLVQTIRS